MLQAKQHPAAIPVKKRKLPSAQNVVWTLSSANMRSQEDAKERVRVRNKKSMEEEGENPSFSIVLELI